MSLATGSFEEIDSTSLDRARRAAEASGMRLDQVVVQLGLISEDALRSAAAAEMGLAEAGPDSFPIEPLFSELLAPAFLRHAGLVPLIDQPDFVELAISDPFDSFSPGLVAAKLGKPVRLRLAKKRDIEQAIDDLYGGKETAPGQTPAAELSATDLDRLRDLAGDAPTVQFVDRMIDSAIELGASDIHLSHTARGPRLRYRVDGLLREGDAPPESLYSGTVSRLKIMAGLDIAERRLPQDGHIAVVSRGRAADLRVATTPHVHGEGVVLRLLDRGPVTTDFAALGLGSATRATLEQALKAPNGLILVTGPTGSGKTTTLYAALATLRGEERNIVSIEDPVERHVEGVNQIQVARKAGIGFAEALRSVLRQDPDVIMVGEIRDRETAAVAIQAALGDEPRSARRDRPGAGASPCDDQKRGGHLSPVRLRPRAKGDRSDVGDDRPCRLLRGRSFQGRTALPPEEGP
jgi:general secretion pathway protein E